MIHIEPGRETAKFGHKVPRKWDFKKSGRQETAIVEMVSKRSKNSYENIKTLNNKKSIHS